MSEQADKETRLWKANYSETGKLRGGPCVWLYNPRGEAVVLMFPQDRPEADGVVTEIVNGLNSTIIRSSAPDARLREAVAKLLSLQIGFMPQCHKGHVVGEEYEGRKQAILDGMSGFFTEAYLYPLFGKETARTILAIEHELRAALSETKAVCEWVSITNGRQQTSCGKIVPMINPTGLAMNFYPAGQPTNCLYCGLPISVKEK